MGSGHFPVAGQADYQRRLARPPLRPAVPPPPGHRHLRRAGHARHRPRAGVVSFNDGGLGGKAAYVTTADGTFYYFAHLDAYADDVHGGASVKQGHVSAYVGNTGNAESGAPHLHFEIHPCGGGAANPKPILDGWLTDAVDNVPAVLAAYSVNVPRAITVAGMLRRFDEGRLPAPAARRRRPCCGRRR